MFAFTSSRARRLRQKRFRVDNLLRIEELESRNVLSWLGAPPAVVALPASATRVALNDVGYAYQYSSIDFGEEEYGYFRAGRTGLYQIYANAYQSNIDTVVGLFDVFGNRIAYNDDIDANNKSSLININLQAGVTYFFGISNYYGHAMGSYYWVIDGPDQDDAFENNDSLATAANLGTVTSPKSYTNLSLNDGVDWYKFTMNGSGSFTDYVQANFSAAQGDVDLAIYNSAGILVRYSDSSTDSEFVSLNGLSNGTYYAVVYGFQGATNPSYSLTIDPAAANVADDSAEPNDNYLQATNLGVLTTTYSRKGLALQDLQDWYKFTMTGNGTSASQVRLNFSHAAGDIDMILYSASGETLRASTTNTNQEQVFLNGLPAGTYYIQVYGYYGARNPSYSLTVVPGTATVRDDSLENNDTRAKAFNLGTLTTLKKVAGLSMVDTADWFKFTMTGAGTANHYVRMHLLNQQGDLNLELYNSAGSRVGVSSAYSNLESIPLAGRAKGTYYLRVYGVSGVKNSNYSLEINPGGAVTDDIYEDNESPGAATDLGVLRTTRTISNLSLRDGNDYYKFTMTQAGAATDAIQISFNNTRGNLQLQLLNASGTVLAGSATTSNTERISLRGRPAGTYFVRVYGTSNPSYSLQVIPGNDPPPSNFKTLFVNFEGANLTRSDLVRYSADWGIAGLDHLDNNNNGILAKKFLANNANRTTIINQILAKVQEDMRPFGINVKRHFGKPVENQRTTTVYVGPVDYPIQATGVAGDIDYGNDNRTDIAFVRENIATNASLVQYHADLIVHESGHTFGLFHVNSPGTVEAMGAGYSENTFYGMDVSYMNRDFPEYQNHGGGRGHQNSFATLTANFSNNGAAAAGGAGNPGGADSPVGYFGYDKDGNIQLLHQDGVDAGIDLVPSYLLRPKPDHHEHDHHDHDHHEVDDAPHFGEYESESSFGFDVFLQEILPHEHELDDMTEHHHHAEDFHHEEILTPTIPEVPITMYIESQTVRRGKDDLGALAGSPGATSIRPLLVTARPSLRAVVDERVSVVENFDTDSARESLAVLGNYGFLGSTEADYIPEEGDGPAEEADDTSE